MIQTYLAHLVSATLNIVHLRVNQPSTRYFILALLSRFPSVSIMGETNFFPGFSV